MSEKVYIGSGKVLVSTKGYEDRFETSFSPDDLRKLLAWSEKTGRWAKVVWSKRKVQGKSGSTHYGVQDTWVPQEGARVDKSSVSAATASIPDEEDGRMMPF